MAVFYERKDRPGVHKIIGSLKGAAWDTPTTGGEGSGEEIEAVSLTVSPDGVLICSGTAPEMDGTTIVYTPTPTMAAHVMTLS